MNRAVRSPCSIPRHGLDSVLYICITIYILKTTFESTSTKNRHQQEDRESTRWDQSRGSAQGEQNLERKRQRPPAGRDIKHIVIWALDSGARLDTHSPLVRRAPPRAPQQGHSRLAVKWPMTPPTALQLPLRGPPYSWTPGSTDTCLDSPLLAPSWLWQQAWTPALAARSRGRASSFSGMS